LLLLLSFYYYLGSTTKPQQTSQGKKRKADTAPAGSSSSPPKRKPNRKLSPEITSVAELIPSDPHPSANQEGMAFLSVLQNAFKGYPFSLAPTSSPTNHDDNSLTKLNSALQSRNNEIEKQLAQSEAKREELAVANEELKKRLEETQTQLRNWQSLFTPDAVSFVSGKFGGNGSDG